ncbi:hypothetical protein F5Y16DRAFT_253496 [Xylariaceae sp. FL0255]|nr:hypothetical protein F5Y16DRAFT_253496 [Xylariaceae sp. FL0255]
MTSILDTVLAGQEPYNTHHQTWHQETSRPNKSSTLSLRPSQASAPTEEHQIKPSKLHSPNFGPLAEVESSHASAAATRPSSDPREYQPRRNDVHGVRTATLPKVHSQHTAPGGKQENQTPKSLSCLSGRLHSRKPTSKHRRERRGHCHRPGPIGSTTDTYEVDEVIQKRTCKNHMDQYLVKWKGWPPEDNTWEWDDPILEELFHAKKDPAYCSWEIY